jgi:hypothetical protein
MSIYSILGAHLSYKKRTITSDRDSFIGFKGCDFATPSIQIIKLQATVRALKTLNGICSFDPTKLYSNLER